MKQVLGYFPWSGYSALLQDDEGALYWDAETPRHPADTESVRIESNLIAVIIELSARLDSLEQREE